MMTSDTVKANLRLMTTLLAMAIATGLVEAAEPIPPIKEVKELTAKPSVFRDATRSKPIILTSAEAAAKYFAKSELAKIAKAVDFEKQKVLVFAWRGSGQDRLDFAVAESAPSQVVFSYKGGRTRDLRPHIKIFALPSEVTWQAK